MYAYATGGSFGLEDMVTTSGPGLTLLYQLFIPFFWCIPVSLVAAELTTAIPVEGGFYRWVRAGFGDFWGFQAGWWNWSASFLLGSSYGVLTADYFTNYLSFYFTIPGWMHYLIAVAVIALIGTSTCAASKWWAGSQTILEISILAPIVVMCVIAATKWHHNPFRRWCRRTCRGFKFRGGAGAGLVALLGLRASLERGGRSGESPAQLSYRARDSHSAFDRHVFSADNVLARGARRLARSGTQDIFPLRQR